MVAGYVLLAIFIFIVYSLTHENSRYAATASAIRQVWTGDCRLGCRHSFFSDGGVSGLSGLAAPTEAQSERRGCLCESCPCGLIEDFLKTCRPATRIFASSVEAVSQYYSDFAKRFTEVFERMARVLECRTSCRRHAQLVTSRSNFDSNEDFTIVEGNKDEKQKSAPVPSVSGTAKQYGDELANKLYDMASKLSPPQPLEKPIAAQAKASDPRQTKPSGTAQITTSASTQTKLPASTQTKPPDPTQTKPPASTQIKPSASSQMKPSYSSSTVTKQSSTSSAAKPSPASTKSTVKSEEKIVPKEPKKASKPKKSKKTKSEDTLKPSTSFVDSTRNCSKCVEQGKTCIGGCPSADLKRSKLGE